MSELCYIHIGKLRIQLGQNVKSTLCRQIGYFNKFFLCGEKGRKIKLLYVVNWAILL